MAQWRIKRGLIRQILPCKDNLETWTGPKKQSRNDQTVHQGLERTERWLGRFLPDCFCFQLRGTGEYAYAVICAGVSKGEC